MATILSVGHHGMGVIGGWHTNLPKSGRIAVSLMYHGISFGDCTVLDAMSLHETVTYVVGWCLFCHSHPLILQQIAFSTMLG